MWHDNETTIDYLNFGVVADACASLLKQSGGQPISIGVSGGWGAGKSSLVKMIAARLEEPSEQQLQKNRYVVITFNPWLYQDFESARSEPPRLYRRLHILRGWSYELTKTILPRSPGAS
ncbi:P-loop NTPase fold protein, partial [Marinobacterium litorale]|uniref:P-loop NTPase fold protein n=1 Tax=Marinobacterium litorale TaxID=404770 RepID=UPI00055F1811